MLNFDGDTDLVANTDVKCEQSLTSRRWLQYQTRTPEQETLELKCKQECIPVGCLPAACRPYPGVYFQGGCIPAEIPPGRYPPPRQVPPRQVPPSWAGTSPRQVHPQSGIPLGRYPPRQEPPQAGTPSWAGTPPVR